MTIEERYQQKCRQPSDINEHLSTLRRYAEECPIIVELGVRGIVSTWALLAAKPAFLTCVDRQNPIEAGGNLDELTELARAAGIQLNFEIADSREIEIPITHLLFIDTWHVYEQLHAELEKHAHRVHKYIILHDTETFGVKGEAEGHRGLWPAVEELLVNGDWRIRERFTNNNGLTVLERVTK